MNFVTVEKRRQEERSKTRSANSSTAASSGAMPEINSADDLERYITNELQTGELLMKTGT